MERQTGAVDLPPPRLNGPSDATSRAQTSSLAAPLADSPLRIHGLTKSYGTTRAIDGLTFEVPLGACYGLVGPNGSGKSTTMRAVVGLVRPDAGTIEVCGVTDDILAVRKSMGVMLDPLQLFDRLTAWEYVATIGQLRELDTDTIEHRSTELFSVLDILDDADRPIAGYSHGMRKKTALAAALLARPRLVMLDEPFEAVDPVSAANIRDILATYVREGGGTVV